ncbi:MAG TPA: non-homologous end-joining DNA ligase [Longimicrobiales bacterium]
MGTAELIEALARGERDGAAVEADGLRFTNLGRVLWPGEGRTKGDVLRYYLRVSEVMLRYLEDRPLMLKRYHDGVAGEAVVQQRVSEPVPDGVRTAKAPTAQGGRVRRYIGGRSTLLYSAQMNTIEFHPWHSRVTSPNRPDWIVLDLDPSPGAGFHKVVRVALRIREALDTLALPCGVKTSGSRGLHVYVPTGGTVDYDTAAAFARRVAERVAADAPSLATVERSVDARGYRVYVDHLQNARGKTAVAPYSLRARRHAPVSMPIDWDEVDDSLDPRGFTIANVPDRLERRGDAWAELFRRPNVRRESFEADPAA